MVKDAVKRWGPVFAWAGVIFGLSSIPTLPRVEILWWDFVLKKTAHMVEYGILWYLLWRAGLSVKQAGWIGLAYAISDEIHQRFVPGRTATLRDVGFDTLGMVSTAYGLRRWAEQKFRRLVKDVSGMQRLAARVIDRARIANVNTIWLRGELGAGKTSLTQAIAARLGVTRTVPSPTFVLMREYQARWGPWQNLYHVDLYRLASLNELKGIELAELWQNKQNLVVVEWADRAGRRDLPRPRLEMRLRMPSATKREVTGEIIN